MERSSWQFSIPFYLLPFRDPRLFLNPVLARPSSSLPYRGRRRYGNIRQSREGSTTARYKTLLLVSWWTRPLVSCLIMFWYLPRVGDKLKPKLLAISHHFISHLVPLTSPLLHGFYSPLTLILAFLSLPISPSKIARLTSPHIAQSAHH